MKAHKHTRKNGPREVLTDLCRTGEWVGITIIALRMDIGRMAALAALTELIANDLVEVEVQPRMWTCTTREKLYRAKAGADPSAIPAIPHDSSGKPLNDEGKILRIVQARGNAEIKHVAESAKVSRNHASRVLRRLVDAGALVRHQGPLPPVGGQRPWIYEVVS